MSAENPASVAMFLPELSGGGAERVAVNLLGPLADRLSRLELVLGHAAGPFLNQVPGDVPRHDLNCRRMSRAIGPLAKYLAAARPDVLMSHMTHANLAAITAARRANVGTKTILVEHLTMSAYRGQLWRERLLRPLARWHYPRADAIVAVSQGAADDLCRVLRLPDSKVHVIYNPVVDERLLSAARADAGHEWLPPGPDPVWLAVGRLTPQKNFGTLLLAFSRLPRGRLLIVGDGPERDELERMAGELGVGERVGFPGFVENPFALMSSATALVLSSRWEALPTVLIEALACGCPVIATDCPTGPREILDGGRYGRLVPPDDVASLAQAMKEVSSVAGDRDQLRARGAAFSVKAAVDQYLQLIATVTRANS